MTAQKRLIQKDFIVEYPMSIINWCLLNTNFVILQGEERIKDSRLWRALSLLFTSILIEFSVLFCAGIFPRLFQNCCYIDRVLLDVALTDLIVMKMVNTKMLLKI